MKKSVSIIYVTYGILKRWETIVDSRGVKMIIVNKKKGAYSYRYFVYPFIPKKDKMAKFFQLLWLKLRVKLNII